MSAEGRKASREAHGDEATELMFRADAYAKTASARVVAVDERGIELDRTIFYPTGGGQQGDAGVLLRANGERIAIVDTRKGDTHGQRAAPRRSPGRRCPSRRRDGRARARLAAPLCADAPAHGAARDVVRRGRAGDRRQHCPDKARLDFDIDMSLLDAAKIERETNALIARGVETETVWITDEELDARPELVKTMSVQPPRGGGRVRLLRIPGIDLQPCGGTHVRNIAEIGAIRVLKIRSEGRRNRRVEIALARLQMNANAEPVTIAVSSKERVSGLLLAPPGARACYVMAHGAGAGMTHPFMAAMAHELAARDIATLSLSVSLHGERLEAPGFARGRARHRPRCSRRSVAASSRTAPGRRRQVVWRAR